MLFLLIVSQAVLEVQKSEPLEADEAWEALLQEATALVAKLDAAHVFSRAAADREGHAVHLPVAQEPSGCGW